MSATPDEMTGAAQLAAVTAAALVDAATAAAMVLPSPSLLLLGPTDGSLSPAGAVGGGSAVVATFTGAMSGSLAIIVDPALEAALAAAQTPMPVVEAVQPALEAASAAIGPAVLTPAALVPAAGVASRADFSWAPLVSDTDGEVLVWVGLLVSDAGAPAAPGTAAVAEALVAAVPAAGRSEHGGLNLLRDVEMTLSVELGRTSMPVRDLLSLAPGSVIELDRAAGAPADLLVNGRLLARGEIVVVDEDYGMRITEIVDPGGEA